MGLGNLGDLGNLDLSQLQQLLPNVNFPATKDEVLSDLQSNDAPQEVLDQVRNSSKDTFNSTPSTAPMRSCRRCRGNYKQTQRVGVSVLAGA